MSDEYLIRNCAPTLAGLKTGSMFSCPCENKELLLSALRQINLRLKDKGLRIIPLRFTETKALIYLYRPGRLSHDLSVQEAASLLHCQGYEYGSCEKMLSQLMKKLRSQTEFPHEIGLFLGLSCGGCSGIHGK